MFNMTWLFELSREQCLGICAFLVPANVAATLQTLIFVAMGLPQRFLVTTSALLYAFALIFHVFSWYVAGVVMVPTFILLGLAVACLAINIWAIASPQSMATILIKLWKNFGDYLMVQKEQSSPLPNSGVPMRSRINPKTQ